MLVVTLGSGAGGEVDVAVGVGVAEPVEPVELVEPAGDGVADGLVAGVMRAPGCGVAVSRGLFSVPVLTGADVCGLAFEFVFESGDVDDGASAGDRLGFDSAIGDMLAPWRRIGGSAGTLGGGGQPGLGGGCISRTTGGAVAMRVTDAAAARPVAATARAWPRAQM